MNNQKETNQTGSFTTYDKQGKSIRLAWQKTTLFSPEFTIAMKAVWPIAREAYTPVEVQFLQAYPEVVGTEDYFKPFEPLFNDGLNAVNWSKVEEVMQTLLKSHFIFDTSTLGTDIIAQYAKDTCYIVTVKDQPTNTLLGFITFMMRANYAPGDIKVMSFAVDQSQQGRGLGKLLMNSILTIDTKINRIFLCTRVTNETALTAYRAWGFTTDEHPILDHAFNLNHWTFLEYKTEKSDGLQKVAATLTE